MSASTGIILNNAMVNFDKNAPNDMKPEKRPLSSMCPTIITDSLDNITLIIGAAGDARMISSVALVNIYNAILTLASRLLRWKALVSQNLIFILKNFFFLRVSTN